MSLHPDIAAVLAGESDGCIVCGDCREVMADMPDKCVDAVVTDPPWNCGYFGAGDDVEWVQYKNTLREWLHASDMCDGQCWFLSTKSIAYVADLFVGWVPFASIKNFSQMGTTTLPNCWDIAFIRDRQKEYKKNGRNWFLSNTAGMSKERTGHPTPRTIDVMLYIIGMFSWSIILDPFCGSGTTCVAAKQLGRRYIGIEIDPKYCEIARERVRNTAKPLFQM